jgi:hypothetical protein
MMLYLIPQLEILMFQKQIQIMVIIQAQILLIGGKLQQQVLMAQQVRKDHKVLQVQVRPLGHFKHLYQLLLHLLEQKVGSLQIQHIFMYAQQLILGKELHGQIGREVAVDNAI